MTESEFFSQLQSLSLAQLSKFHEKVILKIQKIKTISREKEHALKLKKEQERAAQLALQLSNSNDTSTKKGVLPKIPSNNFNVKTMAESLDLDLSSIMREISKR
ncbi:MAG: hypothetical protein ACI9ES_002085 [Oceanospirillaceae bacterium]|jgi:hypothetical protein